MLYAEGKIDTILFNYIIFNFSMAEFKSRADFFIALKWILKGVGLS